jgi:hypothetical protein
MAPVKRHTTITAKAVETYLDFNKSLGTTRYINV